VKPQQAVVDLANWLAIASAQLSHALQRM